MTPPVFLLRPLPDAPRLTLAGPEGRHAATVRRLRVGEYVHVTDGAGVLAECVVAEAGKDRLELDVLARSGVPEPRPRVTVIQALVKGDRSALAVDLLTEVGVDEIVPWAAERCIVRWVPEKSGRRWRLAADEAAKQARRVRWPIVGDLATTPAVAQRLAAADLALVLHEGANEALATAVAVNAAKAGDVVLVVGPEGGIAETELSAFTGAGARTVRLGPSVLRASSAGSAAAAVVMAASGRWN